MKRWYFLLLIGICLPLHTFYLHHDDRQEIIDRWTDIFKEEFDMVHKHEEGTEFHEASNQLCERVCDIIDEYAPIMLNIAQRDADRAGVLLDELHKHETWVKFSTQRTMDAFVEHVRYMLKRLPEEVFSGCTLHIPIRLRELPEQLAQSGLSKEQFCARVRQSFLTFTVAVSLMAQMLSPQ